MRSRRLLAPWPPGATIAVTALIAVVAGFALGRYTTATESMSAVDTSAEDVWLVEMVYPATISGNNPVLDDLTDQVPAEHAAMTVGMYPNPEWKLLTIAAGDYDVHAACRFTEPRLTEYGGSITVDIRFDPDGSTADESLIVDCGGQPRQVGQTVSFRESVVMMLGSQLRGVHAEQVTIGPDLMSVLVDGRWRDADYGLVVYFVPA